MSYNDAQVAHQGSNVELNFNSFSLRPENERKVKVHTPLLLANESRIDLSDLVHFADSAQVTRLLKLYV